MYYFLGFFRNILLSQSLTKRFIFQDNSKTELKIVRKNLENVESELDKTEDECSKLKLSVDSEHQTSNSLRQIITKLEKELAEEKSNSLNVQKTLTR